MEKNSKAISSQIAFRRVALLSSGSFSPPTYMHLRMFERARDYLEKIHGCEVVEGIMSPTADKLGRSDMVAAKHRLKMVQLAVKSSSWIRADGWECSQGEWTKTIHVLNHFKNALMCKYGSEHGGIQLLFLCGGDVIESITKLTISDVMLWNTKQIEEIVRDFGVVVVMRANTDPANAIYLADVLREHQRNIFVIEDETCPNDISSTRLRTAIRRKESIRYCTNDEVIQYIENNALYKASTSFPAIGMKLHSVCKSASTSNLSTNKTVIPFESCLKHSKPTFLPLKRATADTEEFYYKSFVGHSKKDSNQSYVLETSPIWCPSNSLTKYSSVNEELDCTNSYSLSKIQQALPILTANNHYSAKVPNQHKQANFWSSESLDYDNLTLDELLAVSTGWTDYFNTKNDDFHGLTEEEKKLALQTTNLQKKSEQKIVHLNVSEPVQQSEANALSYSAKNLEDKQPLQKEYQNNSLLHTKYEKSEIKDCNNDVKLIYRKYELTSTPETTV